MATATEDRVSETITKRSDGLPEKILEDESFKKEIEKLKEDILKKVENINKLPRSRAARY